MPVERSRWRTRVGVTSEGPNGQVQPQRVLEWMQEAAASASAEGGYPSERYREIGAAWFIREVILAIDAPIRYGDELEIETWVSDLRRFRSRREYRLRIGDHQVGRGQADWLFLSRDAATGKVRPRIPDEAICAAFPRIPETVFDPSAIGAWPEALSSLPPPIDLRKVRASEIDRQRHVNNVVYLAWLEDQARLATGTETELSFVRLEFLADARLHDEVLVAGAWDGDVFVQEIHREERRILRSVMGRRSTPWEE